MVQPNTDVIQGTLDMLILKTLSLEPLHGYGIGRRIEQIFREVFKVNAGSLLTALHRLERALDYVGFFRNCWINDLRTMLAHPRNARGEGAPFQGAFPTPSERSQRSIPQ